MKKVLLGSAAAIAFGAVGFAAVPASAQLELTISGSVEPEFGFVSEDRDEVYGYGAAVATPPTGFTNFTSAGVAGFGGGYGLNAVNLLLADDATVVAANTPTLRQSRRAYGSDTRFILRFNADGTADNGLRYGVRIRLDDNELFQTSTGAVDAGSLYGDTGVLRTRGGVYIRELWGYARGEWGEIRAGESPISFDLLAVGVPTGSMPAGAQGVFTNWPRYVDLAGPGAIAGSYIDSPTSILTRQAASHPSGIGYVLNNFHGFSFGLTYAPTTQGFERTVDQNEVNSGFSDVVSVAANYRGEFSGVRVAISAGGNFANAEDTTVNCTATNCQRHDLREWRVGGQVGYGGFTLGGFYQNSGRGGMRESAIATGQTDQFEAWGVGGHYTTGPWQFDINYVQATVDPVGILGGFTGTGITTRDYAEQWGVGGGVSYSLAPGLTPYASVAYINNNSIFTSDPAVNGTTDFSNSAVVGIVGVNFTF